MEAVQEWVSCDECTFWFHRICIDIIQDKDGNDKTFVCTKCCEPKNTVELAEQPAAPSGSEMVESDGECFNIIGTNDISDDLIDFSGFRTTNILDNVLDADGEGTLSDPVEFGPEIENRQLRDEARSCRDAALRARKLIRDKINNGEIT